MQFPAKCNSMRVDSNGNGIAIGIGIGHAFAVAAQAINDWTRGRVGRTDGWMDAWQNGSLWMCYPQARYPMNS